MSKLTRSLVVAAVAVGSLTAAPAVSARQESRVDRVLVEQLVLTEATFQKATPGWPAQFRARESADALRLKLGH